ncbi:MAG: hypothetical protein K0B06_12345 [Brevefilum sp.]|nr:hypothetical protein [Brevefilum sp.]
MKKKLIIILYAVLLVSLVAVGSVYAQDIPGFRREVQHRYEHTEQLGECDQECEQVCSGEMLHPVLTSLAEAYEVDYEDLLEYFCDFGFGVGEIRLALVTAERVDGVLYTDLLEWRYAEGMKDVGWGRIWQELGLIGRGRQNKEKFMGPEEMNGRPEIPPGLGGTHPGKGLGRTK